MSVATISGVPSSIVQGDTVIFTIGDSEHLATLWTMLFVLSRNGIKILSVAATTATNGRDFAITLAGSDTAAATPGRADWAALFTEIATSQRETGCSGVLLVAPDPAGSLPQTDNQKALATCLAAIARLSASPRSAVSFNGQSFTNRNVSELFAARDRLQMLVNNELSEMGVSRKGGARLIRMRFT